MLYTLTTIYRICFPYKYAFMWLQNMVLFVKGCPENVLLDSRWPRGLKKSSKRISHIEARNQNFSLGRGGLTLRLRIILLGPISAELFKNFDIIVSTKFVILNNHLRVWGAAARQLTILSMSCPCFC